MSDYRLYLLDDLNAERIELQLHPVQEQRPLSELMQIPKEKVYSNREYYALLQSPQKQDVRNLEVQLNGYPIAAKFYEGSGRIHFSDSYLSARIFSDCYGLGQFWLHFRDGSGWHTLVSNRFQVMVAHGNENNNVNSMSAYTALHNRFLLYGTRQDYVRTSELRRNEVPSLEDKVRLLKQTAALLEKSWRSLRTNPKTKITTNTPRYVTSSASLVRHLISHPELIKESPGGSGFCIEGRYVVPDLHGIALQAKSTDVYENQVILAFLDAVCADMTTMQQELSCALNNLPVHVEAREGCISSSAFMRGAIRQAMGNIQSDLESLHAKFAQIREMYRKAIPARAPRLMAMPQATPAFRSLPAYRQIYETIAQWFDIKQAGVYDMRFVQIYMQVTTLYEVYVLTKLERFLEDQGYELLSAIRHVYELESESRYENTPVNNIFTFGKEDIQITLFYQPVLYDGLHQVHNPVGLYRNTSLSLPKTWGDTARGRYYTPDYVLKIEKKGHTGAQYILADAKYANYKNVRDHKVLPLVYKYLFSLTPQNLGDEISGLYIFQGKGASSANLDEILHSVYDMAQNPHAIFPQMEIITLSEYDTTTEEHQFRVLGQLIDNQLQRLGQRQTKEEGTAGMNPFGPVAILSSFS